jgi:hypothetical protein
MPVEYVAFISVIGSSSRQRVRLDKATMAKRKKAAKKAKKAKKGSKRRR